MKIFNKYITVFILFIALLFVSGDKAVFAACGAAKPDRAPDLFQIDATKNSAKLYFVPVNNNVSEYTIIYGLERGANDFGVTFPMGKTSGVIDYTINALNPNTKYYFRVRADNGCRKGWTSDSMSIQTNWDFKIYTRAKGTVEGAKTTITKLPLKMGIPTIKMPKPGEIKITPPITITPKKEEKKVNFIAFLIDIFNKLNPFDNATE